MAGLYEIPEPLKVSAEASGGWLRTLTALPDDPLKQAQELRALCQQADVVVLHLFPYDIVPILALAAGCDGVKTIFVNHSDHTFWVGGSVAHSVAHLRRQSAEFLETKRALKVDGAPIIAIPLNDVERKIPREDAKRRLGYPSQSVLLLTIASPFKYGAPGATGFLELVVPVLERLPQAMLVAVGPEPNGVWLEARTTTGGRITALGTRWDTDLLYAAADIYLDSVPFSSITSLVEAGSHGNPLLGFAMREGELSLLGPGAPGIDETMIIAQDCASYRNQLTRLITDAEYRLTCGDRVRNAIVSLHTGDYWNERVQELYTHVERQQGVALLEHRDQFEASPLPLALSRLYSQANARKMIAKHLSGLPYTRRARTSVELSARGFDQSYMSLLPPPLDSLVRTARRWGKKTVVRMMRRGLSLEPAKSDWQLATAFTSSRSQRDNQGRPQ